MQFSFPMFYQITPAPSSGGKCTTPKKKKISAVDYWHTSEVTTSRTRIYYNNMDNSFKLQVRTRIEAFIGTFLVRRANNLTGLPKIWWICFVAWIVHWLSFSRSISQATLSVFFLPTVATLSSSPFNFATLLTCWLQNKCVWNKVFSAISRACCSYF